MKATIQSLSTGMTRIIVDVPPADIIAAFSSNDVKYRIEKLIEDAFGYLRRNPTIIDERCIVNNFTENQTSEQTE